MKLKILVKIIEKILGIPSSGDGPRADMYMPDKLLANALVYLGGGIGCAIFAVIKFKIMAVVLAVVGVVFGIFALLTWKNQSIQVISDEQFTYTTMFGRTRTYSFADIQWLRNNPDSMTLFVANKKIHIDSMAIISPRLLKLIKNSLEQKK